MYREGGWNDLFLWEPLRTGSRGRPETGISFFRVVSARLADCMDDYVRVARPRVERLSVEMEREAVSLLAVLLADAVRKGDEMSAVMGPADTPSISSSNSSSVTSSN